MFSLFLYSPSSKSCLTLGLKLAPLNTSCWPGQLYWKCHVWQTCKKVRSNSCLEDFLIFFYGFSAPRDPWRGRSVFVHHLAHRLLQREGYYSDRIKSHVCISSGESGLAAVFYLVVTCIIFIWKISEILESFKRCLQRNFKRYTYWDYEQVSVQTYMCACTGES